MTKVIASNPTKYRLLLLVAIFAATSCIGSVVAQQSPTENTYDLVLRNARIADGTGSPWYRADLAVRGDTIVSIAPSIPGTTPSLHPLRNPSIMA